MGKDIHPSVERMAEPLQGVRVVILDKNEQRLWFLSKNTELCTFRKV
ncbi:MAG: hypothetical protein IPI00_09180 [Flavobacteriales bacterium]|nr:hypothetical protein [Flavobacteriales bacterium]MBK7295369.1 hypothetical protein [Flavobacteriales bacterium]MBK9533803.1 hypothetical protein [Flavobacteriales bacterium]MBP9137088.1 hypothetical protein [Flavobacteriales bacterium]HQX28420.1 hypothetical protein [Flavobacteriales bacterium]